MKEKSITIRLSEDDYQIIQYYKDYYHMNNTQVIQSLLKNHLPNNQYQQEIATALCNIYIRLTELGLSDDAISLEVQKLCRMLS